MSQVEEEEEEEELLKCNKHSINIDVLKKVNLSVSSLLIQIYTY